MTPLLFILISFVSSLGDTLFLSGLPLYFFKMSGNEIAASSYIQIAITLTILFASKKIISANKLHPLLLSGFGELLMATVELVILLLHHYFKSPVLILVGVIPLALIYNVYAPAKFLKLQDYFFRSAHRFQLTAVHSGTVRVAGLIGVILSGWAIENWGLNGILIFDLLSFALYGSAVLIVFIRKSPTAEVAVESTRATDANRDFQFPVITTLVMVSLGSLYLSWDRASAIAVIAVANHQSIELASLTRGLIGAAGVAVGILCAKARIKTTWRIWLFSIIVLTVGGSAFGGISGFYAVIFFVGGTLSVLTTPIQRELYRQIEKNDEKYRGVHAMHFVANAILSLSLLPIGILVDQHYGNPLSISLACITTVGLLGGYVIHRLMKWKLV